MGKKIAIIADDLTGANDTGVQFSQQGLQTLVMLDIDRMPEGDEDEVLVFNTDSRAMSPAEAYQRVARVAGMLDAGRFNYIYKKVDSTLRGNLGTEIDAVLDTCGQEIALVAPAFPANNRVTIGGYYILRSMPLAGTEVARDPVAPVRETHLPTLLVAQTKRAVGHVGVNPVLQGTDGIFTALQRLMDNGKKVIVCDVWENGHLEALAQAGIRLGKRILWVGSAGLAECLPRVLGLGTAQTKKRPIVVIAGSVSQVTRNQAARLRQTANAACIEVNTYELLSPATRLRELTRCRTLAIAEISEGRDVLLVSGYSDDVVARTKAAGVSLGFGDRETSDVIAKALGELCRQLVMNQPVGGLVMTGGDIALGCCRALGATGIKVSHEVASGIPLGRLSGGAYDGMKVVTKAGAFGNEDALARALNSLRQKEDNQ